MSCSPTGASDYAGSGRGISAILKQEDTSFDDRRDDINDSNEQLNEDDIDDNDNDIKDEDGKSGSGRRKSSTRSRAVSNLTAEQLARKRAHDRDAQRAIRARTRTHIQSLEDKVQGLENDASDLRRRLGTTLSIVEKVLQENSAEDPRTRIQSSDSINHSQYSSGQLPPNLYQQLLQILELSSPSTRPPEQIHRSPSSSIYGSPGQQLLLQGNSPMPTSSESGNMERLSLDYVLQDQSRSRSMPQRQSDDQQRQSTASQTVSSPTSSEASSFQSISRRPSQNRYPMSPTQGIEYSQRSNSSAEVPKSFRVNASVYWEAMPRHLPPTCPLDKFYLEFLDEQWRKHIDERVPIEIIIGPPSPDITHVIYPRSIRETNPIAQSIAALLGTYEHAVPLAERIAMFYVIYLWMRWKLHPTKETYDWMPKYIVPQPVGIFTAHPIWMDHVPWPLARDIMQSNYIAYSNPEWSLPYATGLSVNWPYEPQSLYTETSSGTLVTNHIFEQHIRDLDNWTVSREFMDLFPILSNSGMKTHEDRQIKDFDMK